VEKLKIFVSSVQKELENERIPDPGRAGYQEIVMFLYPLATGKAGQQSTVDAPTDFGV